MADKELYFEDIKVGDEIPSLEKPITSVSMVMYAASTWDFHRYHHDMEYAKSKGMDAPFLDGQQLGGYLAQQVVDWAGVDATLKRLAFRYTSFVFGGDTLTCKGRVSGK
ncbi:MAG: MaoC/PaaZ C-terminal domain-containing protein, partial [Dehalococcoidia bacterium]